MQGVEAIQALHVWLGFGAEDACGGWERVGVPGGACRAHFLCAARWGLADVRREMLEVEPLARESLGAFVLMKLRGRWAVPAQCEMVLLQGLALKLHDIGFGVVLHKASAKAIRQTIFNNAKSGYLHALKQAKKAGRVTVDVPFEPTGAM